MQVLDNNYAIFHNTIKILQEVIIIDFVFDWITENILLEYVEYAKDNLSKWNMNRHKSTYDMNNLEIKYFV